MFTHVRRRAAEWLLLVAVVALPILLSGCGKDSGPVTAQSSKFKPADGAEIKSADDGQAAVKTGDSTAAPAPPRKVNVKTTPAKDSDAEAAGDAAIPASPFASKSGKSADVAADKGARGGKYPIPKGDTQELVQFFEEMAQRRPSGNTRQELMDDMIEIQEARLAAAQKALRGEMEKEARKKLVDHTRDIHILFIQMGRPQASERMHAFVKELTKSSNPDTSEIGRHQDFQLRIMDIVQNEPKDASEIVAEIKQFVEDEQKSPDAYETVSEVCNALQSVSALRAGLVEALTFLGETYKDDADEKVAQRAKGDLDQAKSLQIDLSGKFEAVVEKKPQADEKLVGAIKELLTQGHRSEALLAIFKQIAYLLEAQLDRHDLALQILDETAAAYQGHEDEKLAESVALAAANAHTRVALIGQPLVVEGVKPDGTPFDWKAYEGKIVLVDFWATWCGPCIEEFPNIAQNYREYKKQGFEVVGVSLDNEMDMVHQFLLRMRLPWTVVVSQELFEKKTIDTKKLDSHPLAEACGIDSIPFVVLIGKDGNVDSIHVRGEKLGKRLEELLGKPADASDADAKEGTKNGAKEKDSKAPKSDARSKSKPSQDAPEGAELKSKEGGGGADEQATEAAPAEEESKVNPYSAKPGLSTADLVKYIEKMLDKPKSIQARPGFAEAICEACDRVMAADPPAKEADLLVAAETKFETLHKAACNGDDKADQKLREFCDQMKSDARPRIAQQVAFYNLERKVLEGDKLPPEQIAELLKELQDYFAKEKLTARHLRIASSTVALINRLESGEEREKHFATFGNAFAKSSDKELARYGKKLAKKPEATESDLVGKEMELAGATAAGTAFDWKKYRGKVVLVDFWATWCGPCLREMPHVKELRERLHDKGFDVVGVSVDKDLEKLAQFLEENQIPWETLAGDETQELAEKYGVRGIPTMMAVDKGGKILGVAHQVEALVPIIEKALGK